MQCFVKFGKIKKKLIVSNMRLNQYNKQWNFIRLSAVFFIERDRGT